MGQRGGTKAVWAPALLQWSRRRARGQRGRSKRPLLFTVLSFTAPRTQELREASVKGYCVCASRPSRVCYKRWGTQSPEGAFCHGQFGLGGREWERPEATWRMVSMCLLGSLQTAPENQFCGLELGQAHHLDPVFGERISS